MNFRESGHQSFFFLLSFPERLSPLLLSLKSIGICNTLLSPILLSIHRSLYIISLPSSKIAILSYLSLTGFFLLYCFQNPTIFFHLIVFTKCVNYIFSSDNN